MEQEKPAGYQYQICVEGHIGTDWVDWSRKVEIHQTFDRCGQRAITLLTVSLPDQPALYGLLDQLRDLNLKLIYTHREEG
jgi:hypothetical protein